MLKFGLEVLPFLGLVGQELGTLKHEKTVESKKARKDHFAINVKVESHSTFPTSFKTISNDPMLVSHPVLIQDYPMDRNGWITYIYAAIMSHAFRQFA